VCTADQVQVVLVEKLGDDFGTERERHAAVVLTPTHRLLVRVGPQQVTQQTLVWHVGRTHDTPDLLHGLQVWTQTYNYQHQYAPLQHHSVIIIIIYFCSPVRAPAFPGWMSYKATKPGSVCPVS